jgi:hypothetical protein
MGMRYITINKAVSTHVFLETEELTQLGELDSVLKSVGKVSRGRFAAYNRAFPFHSLIVLRSTYDVFP